MTPLRQAWANLAPRLKILEPLQFSSGHWSLLERLRAHFNDREAHTHLPIPIARFRDAAAKEIHEHTEQFDDVETTSVDGRWSERFANGTPDAMANYARLYNEDVDRMIGVLVPSARYRKGHYAYGRFTAPAPHGLHTDHSAEDPGARENQSASPGSNSRNALCCRRLQGDDARTKSMLNALRYWIAVPEGEPEDIFEELLTRGTLKTIPVNHVMLMVAGNGSENSQVTQHTAARPPDGGLHSAFFQRQYKLA